jgi:hypothetical protein
VGHRSRHLGRPRLVCGTWARKGDELTVTWLDERPPPDKAIEQEVARLADILGLDQHLKLTSEPTIDV